ncbi:hypothetical protein SEA_ZIKO_150 [Gordonia phage Ziko]|uniref:Uncharacterized protein n=1 Tax=Gordonia phage Ziko TaxID=2591193 RepID=A0A514A5E2_9CAUD|nr:hypothetical protein SEA_ZIKO_150 [Gordonia phage Ziko]
MDRGYRVLVEYSDTHRHPCLQHHEDMVVRMRLEDGTTWYYCVGHSISWSDK